MLTDLWRLPKSRKKELWGARNNSERPAVRGREGQLGTATANIDEGGATELHWDGWLLIGGTGTSGEDGRRSRPGRLVEHHSWRPRNTRELARKDHRGTVKQLCRRDA